MAFNSTNLTVASGIPDPSTIQPLLLGIRPWDYSTSDTLATTTTPGYFDSRFFRAGDIINITAFDGNASYMIYQVSSSPSVSLTFIARNVSSF